MSTHALAIHEPSRMDEDAWKQTISELVRVGTLPDGFSTSDILDLTVYKK